MSTVKQCDICKTAESRYFNVERMANISYYDGFQIFKTKNLDICEQCFIEMKEYIKNKVTNK